MKDEKHRVYPSATRRFPALSKIPPYKVHCSLIFQAERQIHGSKGICATPMLCGAKG